MILKRLGPEEFVQEVMARGKCATELSRFVREGLESVLGEIPAIAWMSYAGDASDGDVLGFAKEIDKCFGVGGEVIFGNIIMLADGARSKDSVSVEPLEESLSSTHAARST